jgi:hypothetical protein
VTLVAGRRVSSCGGPCVARTPTKACAASSKQSRPQAHTNTTAADSAAFASTSPTPAQYPAAASAEPTLRSSHICGRSKRFPHRGGQAAAVRAVSIDVGIIGKAYAPVNDTGLLRASPGAAGTKVTKREQSTGLRLRLREQFGEDGGLAQAEVPGSSQQRDRPLLEGESQAAEGLAGSRRGELGDVAAAELH